MPSFIDLHSGTPPELASVSEENTPTESRSHSPMLRANDQSMKRGSSSDSFMSASAEDKSAARPVPSVGAGRGKRRTRVDRAKYDAEGKLPYTLEFAKLMGQS
jgi:hypothetical protein